MDRVAEALEDREAEAVAARLRNGEPSGGDDDGPRLERRRRGALDPPAIGSWSQRGHEGPGFYCVLWVDGVKGAEAIDQGDGGMVYWHWFDQEAKRKFAEHVASLPERETGLEFGLPSMMKKPTADDVIVDLICELEVRKAFKRKCRTQTLIRLKGDKPDEYRALKVAFTPAVAEQIRRKYGDQLVEVINEWVR